MRPHPPTFTVPEGLMDIGRQCYPHKCWWVGGQLARRVRRRNQIRELPKRLGKKTYRRSGSHDFVPYPDEPLYRELFLEVVKHYERVFGEGPVREPDLVLQPDLLGWLEAVVSGDEWGVDIEVEVEVEM